MPTPDEIAEAMRLLGFDPDKTQTVIVTADTAVAISTDYPEPLVAPEEASDGQ